MLSQKAQELIFEYEGLDQPSEWPGGSSGITIGIGYDLGFATIKQFNDDWGPFLTPAELVSLVMAIGKTGNEAKELAEKFEQIHIKRQDAEKVFLMRSVPNEERKTSTAFPGVRNLPPDAYGALVSLVYNRGTSMAGDSRAEMRAIRPAVVNIDLTEIAKQLRSMKRLWVGKNLDGLIKRREAEAKLVESCIT